MNCIKVPAKKSLALVSLFLGCAVAPAETENAGDSAGFSPASVPVESSRELYNAGTEKLRDGKLNDAEALLQSALAKQDERIQPLALYNLGSTRMAQGAAELKKNPPAGAALAHGKTAGENGDAAIARAESALAGNDVDRLVAAYIAGRGARKDLRAATDAVRRAMETYGKTLLKWRRSLGDFESAAELRPDDADALKNAQTMERAIAKLVDSLREMQQMNMKMGACQSRLNELLKQIRGRIPKEMAPPGGAGDDDDEQLPPEALKGFKEAAHKESGRMEMTLSPEEAAQFLEGIQPEGKLLPMGQGDQGKTRDRNLRPW